MAKKTKKTVYDIITEKIIEQIESGTPPWKAGWMRKHFNGFAKREYQGLNQLLLSWDMQVMEYISPVWFSFKQIQQLGGNIKKGAKSSMVIFNKKITAQNNDKDEEKEGKKDDLEVFDESEQGKDKQEDRKDKKPKTFFLMRYYRVFNLDDVEGIDKSKYVNLANTKEEKPENIVKGMQNDGLNIQYTGVQPCYIPSWDTVQIPDIGNFESTDSYYSSLFHEIAHSTGHESRLKRAGVSNIDTGDKHQYSYEELVAEIGAAFLMAETGMKINYENSSAYVKGWSQFIKNNKKAIFQASAEARKAVQYVVHKAERASDSKVA